jgi:Coenzyme PQQ synthesis protein D (PqqD)
MQSESFKVNPAKVVHETIQGEAIVIHLESGFYYSIDGVGAEIWGLLADGVSVDDVAGELGTRYAADETKIAEEVRRLASELVDEELLDAADGPVPAPAGAAHEGGNGNGTKLEFSAPMLMKYEEMQDFLLADPIHQTTEAGWPETRPEA